MDSTPANGGPLRVLIYEPRALWRSLLREALLGQAVEVVTVQTYAQAQEALLHERFAAALVDLWLDGALADHDLDDNGTHDGLEVIIHLAQHHPSTRLIVLSEPVGYEAVLNTPGLAGEVLFIERHQYDQQALRAAVMKLLGAPETPPEAAALGKRMGETGLLRLDAIAPLIGARPGRPRLLIIEEQSFWSNTLARLMEEAGNFWRVAANTEAALARLRLESFHIALFNLPLGEATSSAWAVLDFLVHRCPKTRLFIISGGMTSTEVARLFMNYPVRGFIDKNTFDKEMLLALIARQMAGPALRIQALGDFRLWQDGKLVHYFGAPGAETLIKALLTRRGALVAVEELAAIVMPNADSAHRLAQIGEVVNAARLALEPDLSRPTDSRLLLREGAAYRLELGGNVEYDVMQLEKALSEARQLEMRGEAALAIKRYEAAQALYQGDFLPLDRAAGWTVKERTALQMHFAEALCRLADLHAANGALDQAITAANASLQIDGYAERSYQRLMRFHACKGDRASAVTVFKALVKLYSELFGEQISAETRELHRRIEAGEPVPCVEGN
jgi:DNA-binding SARP family transcriptional activator/ActR/RegA family two-component response regulator